jgi:hypothetical protein
VAAAARQQRRQLGDGGGSLAAAAWRQRFLGNGSGSAAAAKFLVVESFKMKCYGFNLKNTDQRAAANQIIQDVNNFIFNGWKVARQIWDSWF